MTKLIYIGLLSFGISLFLTALTIFFFKKKKFLLKPTQERWHKKPTPGFGGIAVFTTFILLTFLFYKPISEILPIILGGSAIFLIGILDDIFNIKPYTKLFLEIAIACVMIMLGVHLIFETNPIIYIPLTILWIVGITNAFNLLDNMDGLAPGIGIIAAICLFILSMKLGRSDLLIPSLILGTTLCAFLIFNFNPAKIFLGDSGSLFIGFLLATLSIKGTWHQASNLFLLLLTPLLILGIPIFDTFFVSFQRKMHGLPITQGGKDHSSHRLVMMGWSEKKTVAFLYIIALVLGLTAIVGLDYNAYVKSVVSAIAIITVILFGLFLAQTKVYDKGKRKSEKNGKSKMVNTILYKRRMLDILIDSALIIVAYISAYLIKYDGVISDYNRHLIELSLPVVLVVKLASLYLSGLYRGIWKYIDFEDALKILKGSVVSSMAAVIIIVGFARFEGYSRSLFLIDFVLFIFLLSGSRIALRILRESFYTYVKTGKRVLLIGAGEAGRFVLEEIRKNKSMNLFPIGILDDDENKQGKKMKGVPILGSSNRLKDIVKEKSIEKVLITIPSASTEEKDRLALECEQAGVEYTLMKTFEEIL